MHVAAGTGRVVAGRYYLQDPIGRGAMGTVWRARDALLARDVAVKEVLLRGGSTPEDTQIRYERTLREARTAARLNHPAVVTVYDVVEADGSPWIVMELVQARSLEQILAQDGPLSPHKAADVGSRLLGALSTAHAAGILHRDVKPSNVLLGTDDRAVLTDFGIATREGDPGLTQVGMVMGTPGFTAPERIRGEPATPASDLWSLGATLYAAVEGHGPFDEGGSSLAVLSRIANEDAPRSRSAGALGPAIEALLRRNPRARPDVSTAARLLAAAVATPPANQPFGGGYLGEEFLQQDGDPFGRDEPRRDEPRRDASRRDEPRRDASRRDEPRRDASRRDAYGRDTYRRDTYRGDDPPPVPPAAAAVMPAPMNVLTDAVRPAQPNPQMAPGSSQQATRQQVTRQQAGLAKGAGLFQRANLPWGANLARGANLGRAIGMPTRPDRSLGTDPSGSGAAAPSQPGRHEAQAVGHRAEAAGHRRWLVTGLGAVAIVCAGVVSGLAIGHSGQSSLSTGYHQYTVPAAESGTAAGFTMAIPDGWHASTHGLITDVVDLHEHMSMQVDLAPFEAATSTGEASLLDERAVTDVGFPGYHRLALRPVFLHGSPAAELEFSWQAPRTGRTDVIDVLVKQRTPTGRQAYKLQISAPAADRAASRAIFAEALRTFGPR